ncbi:16S rRNA (cytosine(1402)-N(4))-methyltransferase RsmH [Mahella sp.]|uniref:16S rRNA (cytosine(1402)-N(4))-methyltransferase RsmH n=1 Tax=Mahella sp. TaxID=2798721 RepID=UPI0025C48C2D|nr:16S rRNA (cytosine(1402)-N(4))-methyltransferase RsmH [Mahella sp.]MBZ4666447.1 S-adenosyl-methyltransferase MraW [Mahella sp.]
MNDYHKPVLVNEVMQYMRCREGGIYIDGTIGGGGHALEICRRIGGHGLLIGIDKDDQALAHAAETLKEYSGCVRLIKGDFRYMKALVNDIGVNEVDGVLLDLGVSSHQLDDAERGFSYNAEAALDMRMDKQQLLTARDVVNTYDEKRLYEIIRDYGEERWAKRIASFIVKERQRYPIETTGQLVEVIKKAMPAAARREGPHPARRTFQAIRIEVNDELNSIKEGLIQALDCLKPGGRLCVISFHSLEDRLVKDTFRRWQNPCICPPDTPVCVCGNKPVAAIVTKKPVIATPDEVESNPRARSAKLRVCEKL